MLAEQRANPAMVAIAREARGWTQTDLAQAADVTQGFVSKVESGHVPLADARLGDFARSLEVPVKLLLDSSPQQALEVSCMFHRRRSSKITVAAGKRVIALGHLTRLSVDRLASGVPLPAPTLERLNIADFDSPEEIAKVVRARWQVQPGPLLDLMKLLDHLGVVVVVRDVGTAGQDAFSTWPEGGTPLMVVNTGLPTDRFRFTVAHELGHLVMHVVPNDDQEKQAHRFAAELLMPGEEIADDLAHLTTRQFVRLTELKSKWRVSVGALVQRAADLECISPRQFKEFRIRMSQMGWNTSEPGRLEPEYPSLLAKIISTRRAELGEDDEGLAEAALMTPAAFAAHYLDARSGARRQPERAV